MKRSYPSLVFVLLWASVSFGAEGPAVRTPKEQAQWELVYLYGLMATAGDAARYASGAASGEAARATAGEAARAAVETAVLSATGPTAGQAVKDAANLAARVAAWHGVWASISNLMSLEALSRQAARVAWQSVWSQKESILETIDHHLLPVTFVDPETVDWATVMTDLQTVDTTDDFQRVSPDVQIFFKLAMLRIAYLTARDETQSQRLKAQFLAHSSIAESLTLRRDLVSASLPPMLAQIVLDYEDPLTFQEFLNIMKSTFARKTEAKSPAKSTTKTKKPCAASSTQGPCVIL